MGEIRDITLHAQHVGQNGPTAEEWVDAVMNEFGPGPVHFAGAYEPPIEEQRHHKIVENLDRLAFTFLGLGVFSMAASVVPYTSERPDVGTSMVIFGVCSVIAGIATEHIKEHYDDRGWQIRK